MAHSPLFNALILPVSKARLEAYRALGATDNDTISAYIWNMELAETLYPSLQAFEITVRNSINAALTAKLGSEYWFDDQRVFGGNDGSKQREAIQNARNHLTRNQKSHEPGRIIAELSLGYWSSLFNSPYEGKLWQPDGGLLLRQVFPHAPRWMRSSPNVRTAMDSVRKFRNRVFHYEPIWYRDDLVQLHRTIHQVLAAVSPEMDALVRSIDRFLVVHETGLQNAKQRLTANSASSDN